MPRWTLDQFLAYEAKRKGTPMTTEPSKPAKRIMQSSKPALNKLEAEWLAKLEETPAQHLRAHAITFRLANGVRYTPDFTAWQFNEHDSDRIICWEVKGPHAWEDALVKLKVAATQFPEIDFWLVWKQDGTWQEQKVLP